MLEINIADLTEELRKGAVQFRQIGETLTIYYEGDELPPWPPVEISDPTD